MSGVLEVRAPRSGIFTLYDKDGACLGRVNFDTGRALVGGSLWIVEKVCRMEYDEDWSGDELYPTECFVCSECGAATLEGKPYYCPGCGARTVG